MSFVSNFKVVQTGVSADGEPTVFVKLLDLAQPGALPKWYPARAEVRREVLAVGLSAAATGAEVEGALVAAAEYSEIVYLYLYGK